MERWAGRVALVTGASVGIGAAISKALASHGMTVIGCSRNPDEIEKYSMDLPESSKGKVFGLKCDIRNEEDITAMFKQVREQHGGVDVCINNAGLGHCAPLLQGDYSKFKDMMETNVLGLAVCTSEAYKCMQGRNVDDGHIMNIGSLSGHRVLNNKDMHFYAATKFAVRAMTEGVRNELRDAKSQIRITEISPGLVETEFMTRGKGEEVAKKFFKSIEALKSEDIADAVIYALSAPPHVEVHDILLRPTAQRS